MDDLWDGLHRSRQLGNSSPTRRQQRERKHLALPKCGWGYVRIFRCLHGVAIHIDTKCQFSTSSTPLTRTRQRKEHLVVKTTVTTMMMTAIMTNMFLTLKTCLTFGSESPLYTTGVFVEVRNNTEQYAYLCAVCQASFLYAFNQILEVKRNLLYAKVVLVPTCSLWVRFSSYGRRLPAKEERGARHGP